MDLVPAVNRKDGRAVRFFWLMGLFTPECAVASAALLVRFYSFPSGVIAAGRRHHLAAPSPTTENGPQ